MEFEYVLQKYDRDKLPLYMEVIRKKLSEKLAENIRINQNKLLFTTSLLKYRHRNNVLLPINKGVFTFIENDGKSVLQYKFQFFRMLIVILFFSIVLSVIMQDGGFGFMLFFGVGGGNLVITLIRQRFLLNEIGVDIDSL